MTVTRAFEKSKPAVAGEVLNAVAVVDLVR